MILTIAQHEFVKSFKTGKMWKLLALSQCILGLIFYWLTEDYVFKNQQQLFEHAPTIGMTEAVIHPLFAWAALLFFFLTPLFASNTLTYERKSRTLDLYLLSPISAYTIILGKFLGVFLQQVVLLLPIVMMPLWITLQNRLDVGQVLSGLLGLILLLGANLSLGFFIASLSKEPLIATLVIIVSLFLLSLLEWMSRVVDPSLQWVMEFALLYHCKNFLSGVINTKDIIYYTLFSSGFLYLSIVRLNQEAYFKKHQ